MQERAADSVLQTVEQEVIEALDRSRVPAEMMEGGATPAVRLAERADAGIVDGVHVWQGGHQPVHHRPGLIDLALIVRPFGLALPAIAGEGPVEMRRVIAQDLADPAPVHQRRGRADDVVVDVDAFGHGPADILDLTVDADAGAVAERRVDRGRGRDLPQRQPTPPGEDLGRVHRPAATQADDRRAPRATWSSA